MHALAQAAPPSGLSPFSTRPNRPRLMDARTPIASGESSTAFTLPAAPANLGERDKWPDAWLIAGVRRDPPDAASLDALVGRYWKPLFARCQMLTLDREAARDLAQEAWLRVLRARRGLQPDGDFRAYVTTIAANLWRDRNRTARRAGAMSEDRIASLDAPVPAVEGDGFALSDVLADPSTLPAEEQAVLRMDIDNALDRLTPRLRDVLLARILSGDSCAEIGQRYGRTEQTISAWVREAIAEMKTYLGESRDAPRRGD
jgi:RNA polymerase sigma factor (sigma-70 family)